MVKEAKLEIFSLIKNKQKGLSLVELLFVIIIVAGVLVSLSKFKTPKKYSLPSVVEEINQILQKAYQNALINKSLYQVRFFFDEEHHIVSIGFGPVKNEEAHSPLEKNNVFSLKQSVIAKKFVVNGKDELSASSTKELWFIIYPEGYCQECTIRLQLDLLSGLTGDYIINPFLVVLEEDV